MKPFRSFSEVGFLTHHEHNLDFIRSIHSDFFEIIPDDFLMNQKRLKNFKEKFQHRKVSFYVKNLSFCSDEFPSQLSSDYFNKLNLMGYLNEPLWWSLELSLFRFDQEELKLSIPPIYSQQNLIQFKLKTYDLNKSLSFPLYFENPIHFSEALHFHSLLNEFDFYKLFFKQNTKWILNLDHLIISALLQNKKPLEYLSKFNLENVIAIKICFPENKIKALRNIYANCFYSEWENLLKYISHQSQVNKIIIENKWKAHEIDKINSFIELLKG